MKSIVVTGVSTGIGRATTGVLLEHGFQVFGSVRKTQDADRLSREFGERFVPLLFDVTDEVAVDSAAAHVRARLGGQALFGLVNNAGTVVPGPLLHRSTDDFRRQLEVNLVSVLIVTRAFLPLLGTDRSLRGGPGRIVNIGSGSGRFGSPFIGAYVAAKFGLEGFSECLRRELLVYGIDVIVVAPGPTATPIWDRAEQLDLSEYVGSDYAEPIRRVQEFMVRNGKKGLPAERVARVVRRALTKRRPHVRYAPAPGGFVVGSLPVVMPKRIVDRLIAWKLGMHA